MSNSYTIRIFVPEGDPDACKVINKMNWTGVGLEVARDAWANVKNREEFHQGGVYILYGYQEDEELPTIYIGQGDPVQGRIESHTKNRDFWERAIVFVSNGMPLNRAHITWLEWALIKRAREANRCVLENNTTPNEPALSEFEKADTRAFLNELLSILPLVDLRVLEKPKKISAGAVKTPSSGFNETLDTIVVPAKKDGFKRVFIGENCWYSIRIGGGRLHDIKYIAAYRSNPISAITHFAEVDSIEPYGDGGKYKLNFKAPAETIGPIKFGKAKSGSMQSSRYTSLDRLQKAATLNDLFD